MPNTHPAFLVAMHRALTGRCPNCGLGKLFASYLQQVDRCEDCGEPYGQIRADDAPPWLTILLVGHIVMPIALMVESVATWSVWFGTTLWSTLAVALSVIILPRAKAVFLTGVWLTRPPGSERF